MTRGFIRRGQPLMALVLVLGGWVSARAMMWDAGAMPRVRVAPPPAARSMPDTAPPLAAPRNLPGMPAASGLWSESLADTLPFPAIPVRPGRVRMQQQSGAPAPLAQPAIVPLRAPAIARPVSLARASFAPRASFSLGSPSPVGMAGGHRLMWLAALNRAPAADSALAIPGSAAPYPIAPAPHGGARRWSADGWMLWRRGSRQIVAAGLFAPSYGASQAGAVLRYRLAPQSAHRPSVFLRTTAALNGSNEREAALGLSARPFGRIPVVLAGEARLTFAPGRSMVRPAVFAVTELPPFALPLGFRGEAYAQGGYVGGKFATAFADGQLRVDHRMVSIGASELRMGGGVWGGAQKGASRLDAGPSLVLGAPLGESAAVRLGADWRFRVAGNAAPASGPAVTLSAGF